MEVNNEQLDVDVANLIEPDILLQDQEANDETKDTKIKVESSEKPK